jgi:alpha,alpha-trehalase
MNRRHPNLVNGLISGLLAGVLLALAAAWPDGARAEEPAPYPEPPQDLFKDLFVAVQLAPIFADGKAFPDAAPNAAPEDILAQYHAAHPDSPQALEEFVDSHFAIPAPAAVVSPPSDHTPLVAHIDALWTQLTRRSPVAPSHGSLLALPRRYVVPGGRFGEIYYWDSYFTMLGLQQSGRQDLVADMIGDFAYLIDTYGHIPNGARTYYLSRSQPPFFFAMVGLSSPADPAKAYARYLPELRREYAFWMDGARRLRPGTAYRHVVALSDGAILNRYWDDRDTPRDESFREDTELGRTSGRPPAQLYRDIRAAAESGWDFSSRWFADAQNRATIDTTSLVPIDLNSLLFGLENAIRLGCGAAHDSACAREFAAHVRSRHAAIDRYLWDASRGAYLDYDWPHRTPRPLVSAATLYPLFVDLASAAQAAAVGKTIAGTLLEAGGVVTTTQNTGQQWDAPNGWAPLQWIAISGLRRYGQTALAADIACRWMANVATVYRNTGKLVEKYDVVDTGRRGGGGEYPTQDGFGWTNGVMRKLAVEYPQYLSDSTPTRCSDSP